MNDQHDDFNFQAQPDLSPDLRRIDDALADLVAHERMPAGLTERIFNASVGSLPQRLRLRGRSSGRPAATPHRLRFHRPVWGQLAMAASIGLAFVVAAWFLAVPTGVTEHGDMRAERTDAPSVHTAVHRTVATLSPEAEWLLLETGFNGRASHLVETRDLTFAELRSESQRLFDELEL